MIDSNKLLQILPYTILAVTIYSVIPYPGANTEIITKINITAIWWLILSGILYLFWLSKKHFSDITNEKTMLIVKLFLLWNIFSIVRGFFIAETYWDWKGLINNSMALLIPVVAYSSSHKFVSQTILYFYIKYILPLFIIFAYLISPNIYGFYLAPLSLILLFLPILKLRWKLVIMGLAIVVFLADLGARSNVIKFGVPIIMCLIYYFRLLLSNKILEFARLSLIITPLILFYLAVTGVFNVFRMNDYIVKEIVKKQKSPDGTIIEENLLADTRTFIYEEVLQTAQKYNSWWIGRSPARGNESQSFGSGDMSKRGERLGNEAAIPNIFTWTGIIGVLLYFLVFYKASYLAVNQSNSIFLKILGLFIAFRWLYGWVEDINYFTLTTVFLWFMIGLCFSKSFRAMSDKEFTLWVWSIFDKRYDLVYKWYLYKKQHWNYSKTIQANGSQL